MLVRASLVSALLLSLVAEAGAQDRAPNAGPSGPNPGNPPEKGQMRGPTVDDIFAGAAKTAETARGQIADSPAARAKPGTGEVIRSSRQRVDESGLRYFASQNNQKRVEKEIQRLKALYPDWSPPDDLFLGAPGGPEEQPFWDLFAQDKVQEMRARIAEKMKAEPGWKPSPALLYKLERKESRIKLVAAYNARQWQKVIETAAADPKIMTCSDIDVQWRVGDAFALIGQKGQTFEVYRYVLANCRDKNDRITTLKKALAYFEPREIDILVAMGARNADGSQEFDEIRVDLMRVRLGRSSAGAAVDKLTAQDIAFYEKYTRDRKASGDAALIGWYHLKEKRLEVAETWFRDATEWPEQQRDDGSPLQEPAKIVEGFILTLKAEEKFDEAEALAAKWSPRSPVIQALYVDILGDALLRAQPATTFEKDRLDRYETAVGGMRSAFGAQALGWYHFNRSDWTAAIPWFQASLDWLEAERLAAAAEPAVAEAPAGPGTADGKPAETKSADAKVPDPAKAARSAEKSEPAAKPAAKGKSAPKSAEAKAVEPRPAMPSKADAERAEAKALADRLAAEKAAAEKATEAKTAEGLTIALRNARQRDEAEELSYLWRDRSPPLRALYIDIVAENLVTAPAATSIAQSRIDRYTPIVEAEKSITGAQGLAWYFHDRAQWRDAIGWFKHAIDWSPQGRGDEKMAEGYSQSLRRDGQYASASDVAYDWRDRSKTLRALYFDISGEHLGKMPVTETMPVERLNRFGNLVTLDKSSVGAGAIGWHLYDRKTFRDSLGWFRSGLDFKPEGDTLEKMREGFVLSLRYVGETEEAENRAFDWRETSSLLRQVYFEIAAEDLTRLKPPALMPDARLRRFVTATNDAKSSFGAQAVGWYYHQRGDHQAAADWFNQSLAWGGKITDAKTAQGYLLALISLGRMDEADKLAFEWHEKSDEFRTLYIDVFGGAILRANPPQTFPEAMLRRFEHIAGYARSVFGSQAVAWYYYDRQDWTNASRWFEASLTWSGEGKHDQKTVEGFAQSIRYLARREDAEDILYAWRDKNPLLRKLYIELVSEGLVRTTADIFFSDERLNRYAEVVLQDKDWFGAQGLAWYRHDRRHWPDAVRWFKYAREWSKDAAGDAKMAEGLAFSLRNLDLYDESEFVSVEWKDKSPALRKLYSETVGEYLVRMKPEFAYPNDRMQRYLETVTKDVNNIGAQSAGWYYFARDMYEPAAQWLLASLNWGPDQVRDPKTAEGYVTALRKIGRLADAELTAFDWIDRSEAFRKMYIDIAAEVIAAIKPPADFPMERLARLAELSHTFKSVTGASGLAWYHQARSEWQPAAYWFERTLEWGGDVEDIKAIEGYVVALVGLGRFEEAEKLVFKWRERSDSIAKLYIDVFGGMLLKLPQGDVVPEARLAMYQTLVGGEKSVWGSQAIGWYHYDRVNWQEAARWFESSLTWTQEGQYDAKTVEGFAQSIRYLARREESEDILYPWRDRLPVLRKLYVEMFSEALVRTSADIFFSDERINRYAEVVLQDKDWFGAQGLAWYRHDRRQWPDAVRWFKYAREWSEDGKGDAKMAEGLAFSLRNLDLYDESEFVSVEWKDRTPVMRKLYSETVGEYLVRLKPEATYPNDRMQRFLETTSADHNNIGAQSAGWYYYARDMFDPAAEWFLASLNWGPDQVRDPKTAEGYVTSLRRGGRLGEAEAAAFELRDRSPALRDLYFEIAGEVLANMKPPQDFPADRLARYVEMTEEVRSARGALAIAWYHQAREDWREASAWFERAIEWNGRVDDPKIAEGYLVALIGLGRFEEAENLVHTWRAENPGFATIYLDVFGGSLLKLAANQEVPADRLDRYGVIVGLEKSVYGAQALAWYHYERRNWDEAVRWFQASLGWAPANGRDLKSLEGFAQALRYTGRRDEAEDVLYQWRGANPGMLKLYIETMAEALVQQNAPIAFSDARIDRFAQVVLNERSMLGAQSLGWYRYNRKVWADAVRWFKSARSWSPDGKGDAKLAEGLAFALRNMDLYDESEATSWEWRERAPAVRKLYIETVAEYIVRLKERETYPFDRMSRYQVVLTADRSSIGAQAAGWYYFGRDKFADAATWFRNALEWGPDHVRDPKTAEGLAIALRNSGQYEAAEAFAYDWRLRSPRFAQLYVELAAESLGRLPSGQSFAADRLARLVSFAQATRSAHAAQSIGWYKSARKEWSDATEWFRLALDWTGETKDPKTIEGYAFALRNSDRIDEAETLALAWKDRNESMSSLYIDTVTEQLLKLKPTETYPTDRLASFAKLVTERQHVGGAKAIGWYKLNRNDNTDGEAWFRNAVAWSGDKKDVTTLEGYAVALKRLNKYDEAEALAFDGRDKSETMSEMYRLTMIERMVKTQPPATIPADRLKRFAENVTATRFASGARAFGWYHYDRKDWPAALDWFKRSGEWETDPKLTKGAEGYVLTLKNMGRIEDAEAFAYDARDRSPEMRALYIDLVPEMLARVADDKTFPADRLKRFSDQVTAAKSAYGAQAIAWYRFTRKDPQALAWFKSALDWSGEARDPKTAEGYVLALRTAGQFDQAETIAYEWRDRADTLRTQYIEVFAEALTRNNPPPAFAPDRLARYASVVSTDKNAIGAQALGWYSFNIKQYRPARAWFEKAMQWTPSEGSALGLALSARAMKDMAGYAQIVNLYRATYPKLMELLAPQAAAPGTQTWATTQIPAQPQARVVEEYRTVTVPARGRGRARAAEAPARASGGGAPQNNAACIASIEAKQRAGSATSQDLVQKGWCLLNADRPQEAAAAFQRGRGAKGDDASYGAALSMLRSGETDAAASVGENLTSAKKRNDVGLQVLQQRAVAASRGGRHVESLHYLDQRAAYAAEPRDLQMMRGWALWNLGRREAAKRIFTEVDRQLSTSETQKALALVNQPPN